MSSSPSPLLKLELQAAGEHNDTWGDNLNATIVLIEKAIAGRASIATTGGDTTLTDTQYADNQDRCAALDFSGVLVSNANIIVPDRTKSWIVRNQCSGAFTLTVKTSAGTGVAVAQGTVAILWCDGTNVVSVSGDASSLGGIAPADFARRNASNSFTKGVAYTFVDLVDGATITVDATLSKVFAVTLGGNRTLALSNPSDGTEIVLYVTQDGTGGRTLTLPANVLNAVTVATGANATTRLAFRYKSALSSWYAESTTIAAGGSSSVSSVTISGSSTNIDAYALAGSPSGPVTYTFEVAEGVIIGSLSSATPAIDFSGFASGSTIAITVRGLVHGAGGQGGDGGGAGDLVSADVFWGGTDGDPGGDAIKLPSTSGNTITINITTTGRVWGGGGGGGGGGPTHNGDGTSVGSTGGGGGGGAGGGRPGKGGRIAAAQGNNGTAGGVGRSGTNGTGGTGTTSGGTGTAATGGNGGDFGSAGSSGQAQTSGTYDAPAGAGGAAGKAVNYNGGSTPTYPGNTGSPYIKGATS